MGDAAGSSDGSLPNAGGNHVVAPPSDLPEDEHAMWWCFHELGAWDQFRLPDEELNSRISREGRRRAMSHRRRDNRECLERLEAAAQPPQSTTSAPLASPQAMVSTHLPDVILRDGHQSVASNYNIQEMWSRIDTGAHSQWTGWISVISTHRSTALSWTRGSFQKQKNGVPASTSSPMKP